jgi:hypothetical protein
MLNKFILFIVLCLSSQAIAAKPTTGVLFGSTTLVQVNVTWSDNKWTGTAVVDLDGTGINVGMQLVWKNSSYWVLSAKTKNLPPFSPPQFKGVTINPNYFSGTIAKYGSVAIVQLGYTPFTFAVHGVRITGSLSFGTQCPFRNQDNTPDMTKCPVVKAGHSPIYASLTSAILNDRHNITGGLSLTYASFENQLPWFRMESARLDAINVGLVSISDSSLVIWYGPRKDSYDPKMALPDLSASTDGFSLEYCGKFTISVPQITNLAKSGCARPSPAGWVIGQSGIQTGLGIAWTSLTNFKNGPLPNASFYNVAKKLIKDVGTVSGKWPLPGKLGNELGVPGQYCKVTGTAKNGIDLTGECPVNIGLGEAPLVWKLSQVHAFIHLGGAGGKFKASAPTIASFGWAPLVYQMPLNVTLKSSDARAMSMVVSAHGVGKTTESHDGLTSATALKNPKEAKFLWENAFGITGLKLWSLTATFQWTGLGVPQVGFQLVSYLNPSKFAGLMTGTDWMFSSLTLSNQQATPCFAFGFDGSRGNSRLNIKNVLVASKFAVGVAKSSCSVGSLSLPAGFSGLILESQIGGGSFSIQLQRSGHTLFQGKAGVTNVNIAGVSYPQIELNVVVQQDANGNVQTQSVQFTGDMSTQIGTFASIVSLDMGTNGLTQTLTVTGANIVFSSASNGFEIKSIGFSATIFAPASGCSSWGAGFAATIKMKDKTYSVNQASLSFSCGTLTSFVFSMSISHVEKWSGVTKTGTLSIVYFDKPGTTTTYASSMQGAGYRVTTNQVQYQKGLIGVLALTSHRTFSNKYQGRTFNRRVTLGIVLGFGVYTTTTNSNWQYAIGAGGMWFQHFWYLLLSLLRSRCPDRVSHQFPTFQCPFL